MDIGKARNDWGCYGSTRANAWPGQAQTHREADIIFAIAGYNI